MEIIFHSHVNKTHFHKKGCAPSLILKVRVFGTRKSRGLFDTPSNILQAEVRKCFPKLRDKFLVPFCGEVRICVQLSF